MRALRTLIVDDEPLALRRLATSLRGIEDIQVIGSTTSARRALTLIGELKPDLVLLDVTMPGLDGFNLLEQLPDADRPAIVFVTAHAGYAAKAFEVEAVDYLLKPVSHDRLRGAIRRALYWLGREEESFARRSDMQAMPALDAAGEDSLWVHRHQAFDRVAIDDIVWIEAQGDYVRIHTRNGGGMARATLYELEGLLNSQHFIRIHRSAICRRSAIVRVQRKATGAVTATLVNGDEAPVGRTYSGGLRTFLDRIRADENRSRRSRSD